MLLLWTAIIMLSLCSHFLCLVQAKLEESALLKLPLTYRVRDIHFSPVACRRSSDIHNQVASLNMRFVIATRSGNGQKEHDFRCDLRLFSISEMRDTIAYIFFLLLNATLIRTAPGGAGATTGSDTSIILDNLVPSVQNVTSRYINFFQRCEVRENN